MTALAAVAALATAGSGCAVKRAESIDQQPRTSIGAAQALPSALLDFERRPCHGLCPVYSVVVTEDGTVRFTGRLNVDSIGSRQGRVAGNKLAEIGALLTEMRFELFEDQYVAGSRFCGAYAADAPTVVVSATINRRVKRVEHDLGCAAAPPTLVRLETKIDEILGTVRWIGLR